MNVRKCVVTCLTLVLFSAFLVGVASAQTYPAPAQQPTKPAQPMQPAQQPGTQTPAPMTTGGLPNVSNLKAFAAEANFMSLPGYLRYVAHQQTGQWLTYKEAARAVQQQRGQ